MGVIPIVSPVHAHFLFRHNKLTSVSCPLRQIWTTAPDGTTFDTNDWKINGGTATGESSVAAFNKILEDVPSLDTFVSFFLPLFSSSRLI